MSNQSTGNNHLPVAPLRVTAFESCRDLAGKVNAYLVRTRASGAEVTNEHRRPLHHRDYDADSYLPSINYPRFGTDEGKGAVNESVHGADLFVMINVTSYSLTYKVNGNENHMSLDDHFQDLKRIIAAGGAVAYRMNMIIPFLCEGHQHGRVKRESLGCAYVLARPANMGIENFITFDARDPRIQSATPLSSFDNFIPTYQFIKTCFLNISDMEADKDHLMIISPDEGAIDRTICILNTLGVDISMFYKRHDCSKVVSGRNPTVAREFLGANVKDGDVLIIDDMISSGGSMMDTTKNLKDHDCKRVIVCATFGLFTNGVKSSREKYDVGTIGYVCAANLNYHRPELLEEPWYLEVDMSPYLACIIDSLNADASPGDKLSSTRKIQDLLKNLQNEEYQHFGSVIE